MATPKQLLSVTSAVAVLVLCAATAGSGKDDQRAAETPLAQEVPPAFERAVQEVVIPAQASDEYLRALYLQWEHDLARRRSDAGAGEVVTSDPTRIGALY